MEATRELDGASAFGQIIRVRASREEKEIGAATLDHRADRTSEWDGERDTEHPLPPTLRSPPRRSPARRSPPRRSPPRLSPPRRDEKVPTRQMPRRDERLPSRSRPRSEGRGGAVLGRRQSQAYRLMLADLPADMDKEELLDIASEYGKILSHDMWRKGDSQSASVEYGSMSEASNACKELDDRRIEGWAKRITAKLDTKG